VSRLVAPLSFAVLAALPISLLGAGSAAAHAQWLLAHASVCAPGDSVRVELGSGHAFPQSDTAEDPEEAAVWSVAPDGTRRRLTMRVQGSRLESVFVPDSYGCHRLFFEVDRGLISRTAEGWSDGGRDRWPDAEQCLHYFIGSSTCVSCGSGVWESAALGLPLEVQVEAIEAGSVVVRAYLAGAPAPDLEIRLWDAATGFALLGRTDADGRYHIAGDLATDDGLFLSATYYRDWEPGGNCDRDVFRFNVIVPASLVRDPG